MTTILSRLGISSIALVILSGCASVTVDQMSTVSIKTGQAPQLNQVSTATVGGTIFTQFKYWSRTGYRLDEPVAISFALGRIVAPQGTFVAKAKSDNETAYCTEEKTYIDPLAGPWAISCFFGGQGVLTRVSATPGMVTMSKDLPKPVPFSISELTSAHESAFKYELLYQGISKKILRVAYREFLRDMARPSFYQDATYDIEDLPTTISFRSVSIRVFSADNNILKYEILSGF